MTATSRSENEAPKSGRRWGTPFWLDAFLATALAHVALAVHLRLTGWSAMAAEWLALPRALWWWGVVFFPGFAVLLLVGFCSRPRHLAPLVIGAFVLYVVMAVVAPRMVS